MRSGWGRAGLSVRAGPLWALCLGRAGPVWALCSGRAGPGSLFGPSGGSGRSRAWSPAAVPDPSPQGRAWPAVPQPSPARPAAPAAGNEPHGLSELPGTLTPGDFNPSPGGVVVCPQQPQAGASAVSGREEPGPERWSGNLQSLDPRWPLRGSDPKGDSRTCLHVP